MSLFADQQSGNLNIRYVVKVVKQSKQKFTALSKGPKNMGYMN